MIKLQGKYFSNNLIKGPFPPGSALEETGETKSAWAKKKSASKVSREVVWKGERVAPFPPPQATA